MRYSCLVAVLAALTIPSFANQTDPSGWQYDAVMPDHLSDTSNPVVADVNAINDLLAKMLRCWNAHDLDGYLSALWKSPQLLIILDNQQFQGWDAVNATYRAGFADLSKMGQAQPLRTQIRVTKPDLALVHDEWMVRYPSENRQVVGSSTMTLQKLDGEWKIISSYSRFSPATSRGWEYDSIAPEHPTASPSSEQADIEAINLLLKKMDDRWNAHDVDGFMTVFWKSPQLLAISQEEQIQGWDMLYDTYKRGYTDPNAMGTIDPSRVQIRLVKQDLAVAVNWWTISYPNSKVHVVGTTTMDLEKFQDGWKIILAHSSFAEP